MTSLDRSGQLDERFAGDRLDESVWVPYYLPHWSSRAGSAAAHAVADGKLRLTVGPEHPLWCADRHEEPLRVSCVQTGSFAGPVGSGVGQQPFRDGLTVSEAQPELRGCTPLYRRIGVEMRAAVSARSMFALWLSGFEDEPERSGEICVAEVFGESVRDGAADVGIGVHRFRDPALTERFGTVRLPIEVAEFHRYEVEWAPGQVTFRVDGQVIGHQDQAPDYPVQLMLGVFDFPGRAVPGAPVPTAELVARQVWVQPLD